MALMGLLEVCLESDKFCFLPQMGAICRMLARAATDQNPEMKQKVAGFSADLSRALPEKVI